MNVGTIPTQRDSLDGSTQVEVPGNIRFEIKVIEEPEMGATHLVREIACADDRFPCEILLDTFTTDNPYGFVEAAREAEVFTLEERWAMDAERGW